MIELINQIELAEDAIKCLTGYQVVHDALRNCKEYLLAQQKMETLIREGQHESYNQKQY